MKNIELKDSIKTLKITIKHFKNRLHVVKKQYEKTTKEYLKLFDNISEANKKLQQEIDDHKQTEEELIKFKTISDMASYGSAISDFEGNLIYINETFSQMHGYMQKELINKNISILHNKEQMKNVKGLIKQLIHQGSFVAEEVWHKRKNGTVFPTLMTGTSIKDDKGKSIYLSATVIDITERKQDEVELKHSHKQLQALTEYLHKVREDERTLIAREIHDELGQALTALKIDFSWIERNIPKKNYSLSEKIKSMNKIIDKAIKTTKEMSAKLRPSILDDLGLDSALAWYAKDFQNRTEIHCNIHADIKDLALDQSRSTTIFRIFQESLTNVARHANAKNVKVNVNMTKRNLVLRIEDDGKGIKEEQIKDSKSFGLIGMRERLELLKGELKIHSVKDKGTTVVAILPLEIREETR
ncbi:PAS domain S-box protein [Candidatus Latescibacterota bacterium]